MTNVTVLMTTYNENTKVFKESIDSILNQTYKDFKVLIIVDNPKNSELIDLIKEYAKKDERVQFDINEHNLGLPLALNRGIDLIDTKYIARMDADDIADEKRLEIQVEYAKNNPDTDLFGANIIYMGYNGEVLYNRGAIPTEYNSIKEIMKCANVFNHPTFFGKTEVFKKYKYRDLKYSQDYDFMCRLLLAGCKVENMPDYLLKYREVQNVNINKLVTQRVIYSCVQKNYAKGTLNEVDIIAETKKEIEKLNIEKEAKGISLYDKAFENLKYKKRLKFVALLLASFCYSKYQRRQIFNLIKYYMIKKKYSKIA